MSYETLSIISNEKITENIYKMTIPFAESPAPGQFFMLKKPDGAVLLPRPISVHDYADGKVSLAYQVVGRGTKELSEMRAGDKISVTGSLGNGFPIGDISGKIALVSGGIGIAPMLLTAKRLVGKGSDVTCFCGFRDEAFLTDGLEKLSVEIKIASESGNHGAKGFVTSILKPEAYDYVLCCGPNPMMKAVVAMCAEKNIPVFISMENKMACGIGGCLVCTCADKNGKSLRACKDGPVFRGEDIDFDA